VAGVPFVGLNRGMPVDEVRALTFFALILVIVALILINRSFSLSVWTAIFRLNPARLWIVGSRSSGLLRLISFGLGLCIPTIRR
jgi:Ca2+-transporting ATPase